MGGDQVMIQLANGTYASADLQFLCVGPSAIILGNTAGRTAVTVNGVSEPAINCSGGAAGGCRIPGSAGPRSSIAIKGAQFTSAAFTGVWRSQAQQSVNLSELQSVAAWRETAEKEFHDVGVTGRLVQNCTLRQRPVSHELGCAGEVAT